MGLINAHRLVDGQQLQDLLNSRGGVCPLDGYPLWVPDSIDSSFVYQLTRCPVDDIMLAFKAYISSQVQAQTPVTGAIVDPAERFGKIREMVLELAISWLRTPANCPTHIADFINTDRFLPRLVFDNLITQGYVTMIDIPT